MRWLVVVLAVFFVVLQYRLWFGEGSFAQKVELTRQIEQQRHKNERLEERNRILAEEVEGLRHGLEAIEERARSDLGMVKEGESFFLVLDKRAKTEEKTPTLEASAEQPLDTIDSGAEESSPQ